MIAMIANMTTKTNVAERPCAGDHPNPRETRDNCRLCRLYVTDYRYRELWGGDPSETEDSFPPHGPPQALQPRPRAAVRSLPCVSEGQVIEYCKSFTGNQAEARHVRDCDVHERATRQFMSPLTKNCAECKDYGIAFRHSQGGLGDAVVAYYTACGLANAGYRVHFHTFHPEWFAFFDHPGVTVMRNADHVIDCCGEYDQQLQAVAERKRFTRGQWYADQIAMRAEINRFAPARPKTFAPTASPVTAGKVFVSPFSADQARTYPAFRWREIVRKLTAAGLDVVALGAANDVGKLHEMFHDLSVTWYYGQSATWVMSALASAKLVIGNDSGITHCAGLAGVPTIAIMAQFTPEVVFGDAPSVRGVVPGGWACCGCAGKAPRYRGDPCAVRCDALFSVEPAAVLSAVEGMFPGIFREMASS